MRLETNEKYEREPPLQKSIQGIQIYDAQLLPFNCAAELHT
jgi:hypothetical protein